MIGLRYGISVFSERTTEGKLELVPDWYGEANGGGFPLESIHPYGFRSRPRDPDVDPNGQPTVGCGLLYTEDGGEGQALPVQDPRDFASLEDEQKGGAQVYAITSAGRVSRVFLNGSTGALTVEVNAAGGTSTVKIESDGTIRMSHFSGAEISVGSTGTTITGTGGAPAALAKAAEVQAFAAGALVLFGQLMAAVNALVPGSVVGPLPVLAATVATTKVQGA
jgi:hypothetical protein